MRGAPATAIWQPGAHDTAVIAAGTAIVDAVGQHAGAVQVAAPAGSAATPSLAVAGGWLEIAAPAGHRRRARWQRRRRADRRRRSTWPGWRRDTAAARFAFTGGTLHAGAVGFDLVDDGGVIAPGRRGGGIGRMRIAANLVINRGALAIGIAGRASDTVDVAGVARLGGALTVDTRDGFRPRPGDAWTILRAAPGRGRAIHARAAAATASPSTATASC